MRFDIIDHTGHSTIDIDDAKANGDTVLSVADAMAKFNALIGDGKTAATRKTGDASYKVTRTFDPTADETLFIPRMQGG